MGRWGLGQKLHEEDMLEGFDVEGNLRTVLCLQVEGCSLCGALLYLSILSLFGFVGFLNKAAQKLDF